MATSRYSAAGEVGEGPLPLAAVSAAAEYCYETLTNAGGNSWLGMIQQNACAIHSFKLLVVWLCGRCLQVK